MQYTKSIYKNPLYKIINHYIKHLIIKYDLHIYKSNIYLYELFYMLISGCNLYKWEMVILKTIINKSGMNYIYNMGKKSDK